MKTLSSLGATGRLSVSFSYSSKAERSKGFGSMKGRVEIGPEFFEPLPDEEIEAWYR